MQFRHGAQAEAGADSQPDDACHADADANPASIDAACRVILVVFGVLGQGSRAHAVRLQRKRSTQRLRYPYRRGHGRFCCRGWSGCGHSWLLQRRRQALVQAVDFDGRRRIVGPEMRRDRPPNVTGGFDDRHPIARVDRHRQAKFLGRDRHAVEQHLQAGARHERTDRDGEAVELRLERLRTCPRHLGSLVVSFAREAFCAAKLRPGARVAAEALVAVGQIERDAQPGDKPAAFPKLGAGIRILARVEQSFRRVEKRVRSSDVAAVGLGASSRRNDKAGDDDGERERAAHSSIQRQRYHGPRAVVEGLTMSRLPATVSISLSVVRSVVGCVVPCVALSACATTQSSDPHSVLVAYARALEEGRADDAYRLLSDDARRGMSLEAFRRSVSDDPEGAKEVGRSLERPTAPAQVTATVTSPSGQELHLVLEKGRWRLDASTIDLYAQDTPRHAIQGFLRALERKRYEILMRYVPDAHKEGLDAAKLQAAWEGHDKEEIQQVVSALKQALPTATIEETGERATMPYGAGSMQLLREHGLWKIENFD
jgi:hypothetical protein